MATLTYSDSFVRGTTNTPEGGLAIFDGAFRIDSFNPRAGILLDVTYRMTIEVAVTGGLINDGTTPFGSAEARYAVDLDPRGNDADGIDAFLPVPVPNGLPAVSLLPGFSNTPVFFEASADTGQRDAGDPADFLGEGALAFGYQAGSGVLAIGGLSLGPQGNSFFSTNTAIFAVTYTFREAREGTQRSEALTGTFVPDVLLGRGGDDDIQALGSNDRVFGDWGRDRINGGAGNDTLNGGQGDDRLAGSTGTDLLRGGAGADSFVFWPGSGPDRIGDWSRWDTLDLQAFDAARGDVRLVSSGRDLRVVVDGDLVVVLANTSSSDVGWGNLLL